MKTIFTYARIQVYRIYGKKLPIIESVPVSENIQIGLPTRNTYIENDKETIRNLEKTGIPVICYNFMPVFDWIGPELEFELPVV